MPIVRLKKIVFALLTLLVLPLRAQTLNYRLQVDETFFENFYIQIEAEELTASRLVLIMPAWVPGTYLRRDWGRTVLDLHAYHRAEELPVVQLSENTWEVDLQDSREVRIRYTVEVMSRDLWKKTVDKDGALVEGATTWMRLRGLEKQPIRLQVDSPVGWRLATALEKDKQSGLLVAENYDQLVDSPILLATDLREFSFNLDGIEHFIVFRGQADFDSSEFVDMVRRIVRYQTGLFAEIPYNRYVFLYTIYPGYRGGGGLEHANSTHIGLQAIQLMQDVHSAANITAHEFFHLWNVKRITHMALLPVDYDRQVHLETLWWLEGVTSYYADLTLLRSGLWSEKEFWQNQEKQIKRLQQNPDRLKTSLAQASLDIWENGYESTSISYYNKGQLVGLLLDVLIRTLTDNRASLDTVFRRLNTCFAHRGKGFTDQELEQTLANIAGSDLDPFFDHYIRGILELPYSQVLAHAGLLVQIDTTARPTIGPLRLLGSDNRIYSIDPRSAAARAGLRRNDRLLAVNGTAIENRNQLGELLSKRQIGDTLSVRIGRADYELTAAVIVDQTDELECRIERCAHVTEMQERIYQGFVRGEETGL